MTIHVGISPSDGQFSCFNDSDKITCDFKLTAFRYDEIEKVRLMFDEIKLKTGKKLGHICIRLFYKYGYEIRKKFVEEGLNYGFNNVQIIKEETPIYLHVMSQINYSPVNGNLIWIYYGLKFYKWEITGQKANFDGISNGDPNTDDLQNIVRQLKSIKEPDVVMYPKEMDKTYFGDISKCRFFDFADCTYMNSRGSLLKARITAGDKKLAEIDTENALSQAIILKFGERELKIFPYGQILPILFSQKLPKEEENVDCLEVFSWVDSKLSFKIPNYDEIYLTFRINLNEIYSVDLTPRPNEFKFFEEKLLPTKIDQSLETEIATTTENYIIPTRDTPYTSNADIVGIDLGTSRCCVAVSRSNGINTVALDNTGERLLPSYIAYDETNVKCGKIVMNRLRNHSKSTIFDSKRIIGRAFNDIEIDLFWPFGILELDGKVYLEVEKFNKKIQMSVETVASDLLKYMKQKTEEFQGKKLFKAVITVPATFTEAQKDATMQAAKLAGWSEIRLLPEAIAAAFAYFIDRPIPNNSTVLLFDLGGGTLDVCIFKIINNQISIISNTGDSKLGGRDFDTVLINYLKNSLTTKYGISLSKDKKYLLMLKCQEIKEDLSIITKTNLFVDDFDVAQNGIIEINVEQFQNMAKPLMIKIQNILNSALFQL